MNENTCITCNKHAHKVLSLLDDIATSECSMGVEDIEDLCEARELLAELLQVTYNEETDRYTPEETS